MPHFRRSLRLPSYDYSQAGAYFLTICTEDRKCSLGSITEGQMQLSAAGQIVHSVWETVPDRFPSVELDVFVLMPNHLHAILVLPDRDAVDRLSSRRRPTLGEIVRTFKAASSRAVRVQAMPNFGWQRDYYEHVIRNERELEHIRQYIVENPMKWELDRENPAVRR